MKKTIIMAISLFLLVGLAVTATAQEDLTEEEEREIRAMDNTHGAMTRLLQLERAIKLQVERGLGVIEFIEENYEDADTSQLEELLNDLEDLGEIVAGTEIENQDYEELASEYVALRREANSLIIEFRTGANNIISEERIAEARERAEQARTQASERVQALRERISEEVNTYNAERLRQTLEHLGKTNEEVQERIQNREITRAEAESIVRETFDEYSLEERRIAAQQLSERLMEMAERRAEAARQARQEYLDRMERIRAERQAALEERERSAEPLRERIDPGRVRPERTEFEVWFEDGTLYFEGTIHKPTPCHEIRHSTTTTRSIPPQVRTDVRVYIENAEECPQVVTPETIRGSVNTRQKPSMYVVYVNNEGLFRTGDIPDMRNGIDDTERPDDRPTTTDGEDTQATTGIER